MTNSSIEEISPRKRATSTNSMIEEPPYKKMFHYDNVEALVDSIIRTPAADLSKDAICTLIELFNCLEKENVRKAILPLVKYDSWIHLTEEHRAYLFQYQPKLELIMKKNLKTYDASIQNDRYFQVHFMLNFIESTVHELELTGTCDSSRLELLIDLLSQLPTRRAVKPLIEARLFTERSAHVSEPSLRMQVQHINKLLAVPINDFTADTLTPFESEEGLEKVREKVRSLCWENGLEELGLSTSARLFGSRAKSEAFFDSIKSPDLLDKILAEVCFVKKQEWTNEFIVKEAFINRVSEMNVVELMIMPNEKSVFEQPNPAIKLGTQFLSVQDYFSRNLALYQQEASGIVRSLVEDAIARLNPEWSSKIDKFSFKGTARMALPLDGFELKKISRNSLVSNKPSSVNAEVIIDVTKNPVSSVQNEWDNIRVGDVVVLVELKRHDQGTGYMWSKIRCCSVISISDAQGNVVGPGQLASEVLMGPKRVMSLSMDPDQYEEDLKTDTHYIFDSIVRVKDSHFKHMLKNLGKFSNSATTCIDLLPDWVSDVLVGYGDPGSVIPASIDQSISNVTMDGLTGGQSEAINSGIRFGLTMIEGKPGTGKSFTAARILEVLGSRYTNERVLFIAKSNEGLNSVLRSINLVPMEYMYKPGGSMEDEFGRSRIINHILGLRVELLKKVRAMAVMMGLAAHADDYAYSCSNARQMFLNIVQPQYALYLRMLEGVREGNFKAEQLLADKLRRGTMPSGWKQALVGGTDLVGGDPKTLAQCLLEKNSFEDVLYPFRDMDNDGARLSMETIENIFKKLEECKVFEVLRTVRDRSQYLLTCQSRIVAITSTGVCNHFESFIDAKVRFSSVIIEDASQMLDIETFLAIVAQKDPKTNLKRIVLIGDGMNLPPVITRKDLTPSFSVSLFERLTRLGVQHCKLDQQIRAPHIAKLWRDDIDVSMEAEYTITGLCYPFQFVHVPGTETQPMMHFYQNLDEAEYVVAMYMYLRLHGWGRDQISILASYNGQRLLIGDVIKGRCGSNPLFGEPAVLTTIDQYQGQENEIVLVSLVRTENPGHNSDVRRLVSALSRAKQAVYVFGNFDTYSSIQSGVGEIVGNMAARNGTQLTLPFHSGPLRVEAVDHMWRIIQEMIKNQLANA